jgi:hypothetical protein
MLHDDNAMIKRRVDEILILIWWWYILRMMTLLHPVVMPGAIDTNTEDTVTPPFCLCLLGCSTLQPGLSTLRPSIQMQDLCETIQSDARPVRLYTENLTFVAVCGSGGTFFVYCVFFWESTGCRQVS